jgi:hypothetical protein
VATGKDLFSSLSSGSAKVSTKTAKVGTTPDGKSWKLLTTSGWYRQGGHWRFASTDKRARFDNDINESGKSLGHYDVLHDLWRKVNGYVSGSHQSYLSRTGYLICSSWDSCYVGVFKGKARSTDGDNWEPLFGWNCGNGNPSKIKSTVEDPSSSWSWDPQWDRFLAEFNTPAKAPKNLPAKNYWAKNLDTTYQGSRLKAIPNSPHERWFTSIHSTLGYHSYLDSTSELGKHISYGCTRLLLENAKWIYDNIYPGTRCLQVRTAKYA